MIEPAQKLALCAGLLLAACGCGNTGDSDSSESTSGDGDACPANTREVAEEGLSIQSQEDLLALEGVTDLVGGPVTLFGAGIRDLGPLRCLEHAENLRLESLEEASDFSPLASLASVGHLYVARSSGDDFGLPSLVEANEIVLFRVDGLRDLSAFPKLAARGESPRVD